MTAVIVSSVTFFATGLLAVILLLVTFVLFAQGRFRATGWTFAGTGVSAVVAVLALLSTLWFAIVEAVTT